MLIDPDVAIIVFMRLSPSWGNNYFPIFVQRTPTQKLRDMRTKLLLDPTDKKHSREQTLFFLVAGDGSDGGLPEGTTTALATAGATAARRVTALVTAAVPPRSHVVGVVVKAATTAAAAPDWRERKKGTLWICDPTNNNQTALLYYVRGKREGPARGIATQ